MTPACTVILAAYRWPAGDDLAAVTRSITDALPWDASVIEAREREDGAVGAAALVNATARAVTEGWLMIARPDCRWSPDPAWEALADLTDEVVLLGLAEGSAPSPRRMPGRSPWVWEPDAVTLPDALIVPAYRFHDLGRLDEALWSIGELEDFAARASVTGATVTRLIVPGRRLPTASFPLPAPTRQFLAIRSRLRTAFKTLPAGILGPDLAMAAAAAVAESADAAAFDRALLERGQSWPRSGRRPPETTARHAVWPRDEVGTLVPLLALDSFVNDLAALVPMREDLQRRRTDMHAPRGPDARPPDALLEAIVDAGLRVRPATGVAART